MAINQKGDREVDFDSEGVTFIFPPQLDDHFVERLEMPDILPEASGGFNPKRPVINLKIFQKTGNTVTYPTKFGPPFEIDIHYKAIDEGDPMECAYHGGPGWARFNKKLHGFDPQPYQSGDPKIKPGFIGYGTAKINDWDDPVIAWGP